MAASVPFISLVELKSRIESDAGELIVLDVRERDAYESGHIPGAGRISTLATSTLRIMGCQRAVALDGGIKAWREAGFPLESGKEP